MNAPQYVEKARKSGMTVSEEREKGRLMFENEMLLGFAKK